MARGSLNRRVRRALLWQAVLLLLVGSSGVLGILMAKQAVDDIADHLLPMRTANAAVLQDLTDAETGVRGWVMSGYRSALEPYFEGLGRLEEHQGRLRELAADDAELVRLADRQEAATAAWVADYGSLRVGDEQPAYSARLYEIGKDRFDRIRTVNAQIVHELRVREDAARERAEEILVSIVALVAVFATITALTAYLLARRLATNVVGPLVRLEETVRRLGGGEPAARATPEGATEVRRVARAVNELADENMRARELEAQVVQQLRELDRVRTDFVSNVSHELRTPLTSIQGYIEVLEDELPELEPQQAALFGTVNRNVERLRDLIEDLLRLSRAESRGTTLKEIDLRGVVAEVASDVRPTARNRDVVVRFIRPEEPVMVLADHSQLLRAVLNVVSNAVKFSHPQGVVDVRLRVLDEEAVVEVEDRGIGIPSGELPRLGSRFYRASNAVNAEIGGTGLGLRIVQTILENHGGGLTLESVEGAGTTVRLTLPRRVLHPVHL